MSTPMQHYLICLVIRKKEEEEYYPNFSIIDLEFSLSLPPVFFT